MRALLVRCYPTAWRQRYGDEFLALLEERPLGPFDVADILLGALDARRRSRGSGRFDLHEGSQTVSLRIGGIAAIAFASIPVFLFLGNGLQGEPFGGWIAVLVFIGMLALLVAITGLSAYQARSSPTLIWTAFAITAAGTLAMFVGAAAGLVGTVAEDVYRVPVVIGGLAAILGSLLFGIATYRISTPFRGAASLLVVGSTLGLAVLPVALVTLDLAYPLMMLAFITFFAGWFALGVQAIRLHPSTATGMAA